MELTGKCKEDFEKWILKLWCVDVSLHDYFIEEFDREWESKKYGVYVDFFDSVGIEINVKGSNGFWYIRVQRSISKGVLF